MAYEFDGSTDRVDWTNTWNPYQNACSVSVWIYPRSTSTGYITNLGESDDSAGVLIRLYDDEHIIWLRSGATSKYRGSLGGGVSLNTWAHLVGRDPATDFGDYTEMTIYKDGTEVSYSSGNSQNGVTESQFTGVHSVGGMKYDDSRCFDGYVCEYAMWDRVITISEKDALAKGYSPLFFPAGLRFHVPLIRPAIDVLSGNYGTLDGTTVVPHPPDILYPAYVASYLESILGKGRAPLVPVQSSQIPVARLAI
jgi:hypothetical protein